MAFFSVSTSVDEKGIVNYSVNPGVSLGSVSSYPVYTYVSPMSFNPVIWNTNSSQPQKSTSPNQQGAYNGSSGGGGSGSTLVGLYQSLVAKLTAIISILKSSR